MLYSTAKPHTTTISNYISNYTLFWVQNHIFRVVISILQMFYVFDVELMQQNILEKLAHEYGMCYTRKEIHLPPTHGNKGSNTYSTGQPIDRARSSRNPATRSPHDDTVSGKAMLWAVLYVFFQGLVARGISWQSGKSENDEKHA